MNNKIDNIKIGVVDDHRLFRNGLTQLIEFLGEEYNVVLSVGNGEELFNQLNEKNLPDIVLLDIEMPGMDGFDTAERLKQHHPSIKVITITMNDDDPTLIKMLKNGARGFLNKDIDPNDLKYAIDSVVEKGYHYSERLTGRLVAILQNEDDLNAAPRISENELRFLKLACSEDPYKVIADKMCLSIKTIDGYRASLFEKLDVKSRVGLVMYAIKHKIVEF